MNRVPTFLFVKASHIHRFCNVGCLSRSNNSSSSTVLQSYLGRQTLNTRNEIFCRHFSLSPIIGAGSTKLKELRKRIEKKVSHASDVSADKVLYVYKKKFVPYAITFFSIAGSVFLFLQLTNAFGIVSGFQEDLPEELLPSDSEIIWYQWWKKLPMRGAAWKWFLILFNMALGWGAFLLCILIPYRIIRRITLLKGGHEAILETFGPFGLSKSFKKPLKEITCGRLARHEATDLLSIRMKGHRGPFALNQTGEYSDKMLFDRTVGMFREFK